MITASACANLRIPGGSSLRPEDSYLRYIELEYIYVAKKGKKDKYMPYKTIQIDLPSSLYAAKTPRTGQETVKT